MEPGVEIFVPSRVYARVGWATLAGSLLVRAGRVSRAACADSRLWPLPRSPPRCSGWPRALRFALAKRSLTLASGPSRGGRFVRSIAAVLFLLWCCGCRLTNSRQKVLVYPGEPEQVQRLLIELRRNSQLATFDGVTYRDYWTWCTLNSPQGHNPLLEQPVRMFSAEDEAEVERLYQKLKAVGRLDARSPGKFLGSRRRLSPSPDSGSLPFDALNDAENVIDSLALRAPLSQRAGAGHRCAPDEGCAAGGAAAGDQARDRFADGGVSAQPGAAVCRALIGLSAVKGMFQYWMRVIIIGISRDIEFDLRNDLFRHLVALSPDFYGRYRTGDIMARATNDLNAVRMMLGPGVMYWTETSLTFILAIAIMLHTDGGLRCWRSCRRRW